MRVPIAWLRSYLDLPESSSEIAERLAALGFPVERIDEPPPLSGVVAGRIAKLERHPNADRLQLCSLDVGEEAPLLIATAATNVALDDIVPVARIGAQLATMRIERRVMRGVESQGMLCSAAELGFEATWFEDGILHLERETPLGVDLVAFFALETATLEVEVTANRPDVLSMIGVARELAAAFDRPLRLPQIERKSYAVELSEVTEMIDVELASSDVVRFVVQRARLRAVGAAPIGLRLLLARAGQRPIDALVDISNFVMLEWGQPLHFYDLERIEGKRIVVRDAAHGERLTTLDGVERELDATELVVSDTRGAIGLAGILGGARSGVTAATRELLIESAAFRGARIRRGAKALGLRTEASARFEKSLPVALVDLAAARAASLLAEYGATIFAPQSSGALPPPTKPVALPEGEIERLLGLVVTLDDAASVLERLGCTTRRDEAMLWVTPPLWRSDLLEAADLVEEVARIVGYDRIEAVEAAVTPTAISSEAYRREREVAEALGAAGFAEIVTLILEPRESYERFLRAECLALGDDDVVEIVNPLSEEQRYLRFSPLAGILATSAARLTGGQPPFDLFEITRSFSKTLQGVVERRHAVWAQIREPLATPPWQDERFRELAGRSVGILRALCGVAPQTRYALLPGLHPGKSAALDVAETEVAFVGVVDPRLLFEYGISAAVGVAVLDLDRLPSRRLARDEPESRFPRSSRDLAFLVAAETPSAELAAAVYSTEPLVRSVEVFDEFRSETIGAGRKSLALRLTLGSAEATLTDAETETAIERILVTVEQRLGAVLRR